MGITEQFCGILLDLTPDSISAAVLAAARRLLLDGIAVALAGSLEPAGQIVADYFRGLGSAEQSSALSFGFRTSAAGAAYVNGAAMHVLDYEPMWNPPSHALSTTLPAALALGESLGADGREILTALIKGIEAHGRLRAASRHYEPRELVFHPPGVAGPIGSAIAASHLLRLNLKQIRNAVGIAASRAGSLLANVGTMTKCTHCGNAASAGVEAALLAAGGMDANPDVLEAPNGLADAFFAQEWDPRALTITDVPLRVLEPGYAIKMFPSQYATHFVILAALDARSRLAAIDRIASVEILGPIMPYVDRPLPATGLEGKFSFQYTAAVAILDGQVTIDSFTDKRRSHSNVAAMLPKVHFVQSPEIPAALDKMWVEIKITLDDGQGVRGKCIRPSGAWGSPIAEQDHLAKVRDCMQRVLSPSETENVINALQHFETLDAPRFQALMRVLSRLAVTAR